MRTHVPVHPKMRVCACVQMSVCSCVCASSYSPATAKARGRKAIRVARKKHATWRVVTLIIHDGIVLGAAKNGEARS
jgi:hypothetical protein